VSGPRATAPFPAATLLVVALLAGPGDRAAAATLDVPGDYPTIYAALVAAAPGDTVSLACGEYHESVLAVPSGVVIRSATGDPACVTLDSQGHGTILYGWGVNADTRIEGLTLTGGAPSNHGGALYFSDSDVRLSNCVLEGNETANWGGGVAFLGTSSPVIEDCVFRGNRSLYGGGLYCEGGSPVVRRCEFRDNAARFSGGGITAWGPACQALVEDCLFAGNEGTFVNGGAVLASSSNVRLIGCTLVANYSEDHGSGVYARVGAQVELKRCIVAFGTGTEALSCDGASDIAVACCDVYKNGEGNFTGCTADQENGNGNFSEDPLFCDADAGDYTLRADSPCLPTGTGNCGLVGSEEAGCGAVAVSARGWGSIKTLYR